MVRGALFDLHAARAAAASSRTSVDDNEGRRSAAGDDGAYLPGSCAIHRNEHRAPADHHFISGDRDLVAKSFGMRGRAGRVVSPHFKSLSPAASGVIIELTLKNVRARMAPRDLAAYAANIGETND